MYKIEKFGNVGNKILDKENNVIGILYETKNKEDLEKNTLIIKNCFELYNIAKKLSMLCPSDEGLGGHANIRAFLQLGENTRKILKNI